MEYLHSMIRVRDLESTLDFFCAGLGFVEINRREHERGRFTLVFLAASDDAGEAKKSKTPLLELTYNWPSNQGIEQLDGGRNFGHLAYKVENIYKLCEHLQTKGVVINRPPRDGYMAFVRSPDGISIELLQRGAALEPAEPWVSMPNIGDW
jgi:lactoylglutathione lyase